MRKKLNQIAGIVFLSVIGGCMAAYPIEDRRIGRFCSAVAAGSDVSAAVEDAESMFGVDIWHRPGSNVVVVKSDFTFKTLCLIQTNQSRVVSALFIND